ncbi:hypothetical protein HRI_001669200 [Hibiscus trionum]|uniref:Uncharacterized protein n=1 Tax=Hibiscus trionum TaxID=183268 RepID=A0A9W7LWS7_HIBTR|nr:hypothetical protein HRI_001669200 [Hibiscus trionum]
MPKELQDLVEEFSDVFASPTGLPPTRATDHSIHLEPGKSPINIRWYRYAHFQKSGIERQVQKMLAT